MLSFLCFRLAFHSKSKYVGHLSAQTQLIKVESRDDYLVYQESPEHQRLEDRVRKWAVESTESCSLRTGCRRGPGFPVPPSVFTLLPKGGLALGLPGGRFDRRDH